MQTYAPAKRFRERYTGDDKFRAAVEADPPGAAAALGIDYDPTPVAYLWRPGAPVDESRPEVRAMRQCENVHRDYLDFCNDDTGALAPYRAWRARQRARSHFSQGALMAPLGLYLPFAVELTKGCSLGCWFCGLSAGRLEEVLPTDLIAWSETLRALRGVFGASAARGFLYWATDPLDHPDYEAYAETFARVLGRYPATTTAAMLKDPERTRRLIRCSRERNSPSLRFSIVTRQRLAKVHETFSAEELVDVDMAIVNRESLLGLAEAGRARDYAKTRPERAAAEREKVKSLSRGAPTQDPEMYSHRTIACVAGFLIEPVVKRLRLIAPEACSDRWPDGYAVFDEARFENAAEFARALTRMVDRNMGSRPPPELALQRGVTLQAASAHSVVARGRGHRVEFRCAGRDVRYLPSLARAFRGGARVAETVVALAERFGLGVAQVREDMTKLWRKGVLIETIFDGATGGDA